MFQSTVGTNENVFVRKLDCRFFDDGLLRGSVNLLGERVPYSTG